MPSSVSLTFLFERANYNCGICVILPMEHRQVGWGWGVGGRLHGVMPIVILLFHGLKLKVRCLKRVDLRWNIFMLEASWQRNDSSCLVIYPPQPMVICHPPPPSPHSPTLPRPPLPPLTCCFPDEARFGDELIEYARSDTSICPIFHGLNRTKDHLVGNKLMEYAQ